VRSVISFEFVPTRISARIHGGRRIGYCCATTGRKCMYRFFAAPDLVLPDHDVIVHVPELDNTWRTGDQDLRSQNQQVQMRRGLWNRVCGVQIRHVRNTDPTTAEGLRMSRQFVQRIVNPSFRLDLNTQPQRCNCSSVRPSTYRAPFRGNFSNSCAISAKSSVDSSTSPADKFSKVRFAFLRHT
jgi:hypothetical protein